MDAVIKAISQHPGGAIIIVKWKNELKIKGEISMIYETDNGVADEDDDRFEEYFACVIHILEILKKSTEDDDLEAGDKIEISKHNQPIEVRLFYDDSLIWRE